ncbi:hypothetical protein [Tamlana sp. I1]|uniref:hypothetical protein n=1 Tax=Tamlana sp. I1 TaxID=2762061 RepID=UPI00188F65AA|nr:hypothetical protein [Tamlana sp. I1]
MGKFYKIILVIILIISTGNLLKNLFNDHALNRILENLELTKQSLNAAMLSNNKAQDEIKIMQIRLSAFKTKNEALQNEIDIINLEAERLKVLTLERRDEIDLELKTKRERILILQNKDQALD